MMYKLEMPATVSLIQVLKLEQSCGTTVAENLGSYWRTEITANSDARRINVLEGEHHEFSHHSPVRIYECGWNKSCHVGLAFANLKCICYFTTK